MAKAIELSPITKSAIVEAQEHLDSIAQGKIDSSDDIDLSSVEAMLKSAGVYRD